MRSIFFLLILTFPQLLFGEIFRVNPDLSLGNGDYSIIIFQNDYGVGKQSGIEIVRSNDRIASNGTIRIELVDGEILTDPEVMSKKALNDSSIQVDLKFPSQNVKFRLIIQYMSDFLRIETIPDEENDLSMIKNYAFEMDVYWAYYAGKTYHSEKSSGILPHDYLGGTYLAQNEVHTHNLAEGPEISLAPEDDFYALKFIAPDHNRLSLRDDRYNHKIGWYTLSKESDSPKKNNLLKIKLNSPIELNNIPELIFPEIGYHSHQPKDIILEFLEKPEDLQKCRLFRMNSDGEEFEVLQSQAVYWGKYFRYEYYKFSFDTVSQEGLYCVMYGENSKSRYFEISDDIYESHVWQPTLTQFMPVQMCHMRVVDRNHIWHDACHLDDGLQVPVNKSIYDGFRQYGETETPFLPNTTIPGMNTGGWHDAGDDDINTNSNGINIYSLLLAVEEFDLYADETLIDFDKKNTIMNHPDGKNDAIQQIIHGLNWLLAPFNHGDHSYAGVISSSFTQYLHTGDWASYSDNLFYDPKLPEDSTNAHFSGKFDDRYVFTNKDSRRDCFVAAIFAASYRVLKDQYPDLAIRCLNKAKMIWKKESSEPPVIQHNVGNPPNYYENLFNASVELYLATHDNIYLEYIVANQEDIFNEFESIAWTISRVIDDITDYNFSHKFNNQLITYSDSFREQLSKSPFGTLDPDQIWGTGWEILWKLYKHYYLVKKYPELFPESNIFNGVHYQLGRHPGANISLVSGVGSRKPIPAFGINRDHMHYTVGGVFSGPSKIKPDFFELRDDTPYIWQQSEYIISGAGPYIFVVLAAEYFLNN